MTGATLSHYRIVSELGKGGMGVVYKAEDTKLDRTVALKLLAPHMLASEADRARFYREARAAAALHHPNIATVFEIDETEDGRPFIAMEYIEGAQLDEGLAERPLPVERAVAIATQMAEALKVAHERGIVHRDIKSANVMLTDDGVVKILDFGLAKTDASTKLTQMGSTVGTIAYMSPEQARGEEVDHRTDLWSLGAVLYEMLTGRVPFPGAYEQAVVYGILNAQPEPVTGLRSGVPMALEQVVEKCLRKDPAHRYQSAVGVLADLRSVAVRPATITRMAADNTSPPARARPAAWIGIALTVLLAALAGWWLGSARTVEEPVRWLPISLPMYKCCQSPGWHPDESGLFYTAADSDGSDVHARFFQLHSGTSTRIAGTDGAEMLDAISPDGAWLAYSPASRRELFRVRSEGGTPVEVPPIRPDRGVSFLPDGSLAGVSQDLTNIVRVGLDGDKSVLVDSLAFAMVGTSLVGYPKLTWIEANLDSLSMYTLGENGRPVEMLRDISMPFSMAPEGEAVFLRFGLQQEARVGLVDPVSWQSTSERILFPEVQNGNFSSSGHYVFRHEGRFDRTTALAVVRRGIESREYRIMRPNSIAVSPDGRFLVFSDSYWGSNEGIRRIDLRDGSTQRLRTSASAAVPFWSRDGSMIYYTDPQWTNDAGGARGPVFRRRADGLGETELIYQSDRIVWSAMPSPDETRLLLQRSESMSSGEDLAIVDIATGETLSEFPGYEPTYSPDGRYVAYTAFRRLWIHDTESGTHSEVFGEAFSRPVWRGDPEAIQIQNRGGDILRLEILKTDGLTIGQVSTVFDLDEGESAVAFDVGPAGDLYVAVRERQQSESNVWVIFNFARQIRDMVEGLGR